MTRPAAYTEYEYRVAMALASNPGLACFDDMNTYAVREAGSHSLWSDNAPLSGAVDESDDYDDQTVMVDVFQVVLSSPREQQLRGRPFKFPPESAIRVVSKRLVGVMPSANIIMVDAFPLTRDIVKEVIRQHLRRTEYSKELNEFLWGPDVEVIDPDKE
jgi:hypothetical protein